MESSSINSGCRHSTEVCLACRLQRSADETALEIIQIQIAELHPELRIIILEKAELKGFSFITENIQAKIDFLTDRAVALEVHLTDLREEEFRLKQRLNSIHELE